MIRQRRSRGRVLVYHKSMGRFGQHPMLP